MGKPSCAALLGGLTPRSFLRRHWQKRPLFVRAAIPGFAGVVSAKELASLASRDDVESRMVVRSRNRWKTEHGPFARRIASPRRDWTLLVNGVNLHVRQAEALLRRFAFVPQARLDDVMVSYAVPGGGVGPHVDSYDVFLLQGSGKRKWTIWGPKGKKHYLCQAGDLLYLPPGVKHDGVALEPCYTYSIGFRAPRGEELAARFLDWLHECGLPDATYRDPHLRPARNPAAVPGAMIDFAYSSLKRIQWSKEDVRRFLGEYLTEPKAHVVFRPARERLRLERSLVRLDPKAQLLYCGSCFFLNGEAFSPPRRQVRLLRELADRRELDGALAERSGLRPLLYDWHRAGLLRASPRRRA